MHTARDPSKLDTAAPILRSDVPFVGRYYVRRLLQAVGPRASYLAHDATHGFTIDSYNLHASLEPGKHVDFEFVADVAGVFPMYCTEFCSALHLEMAGYFLVEPKK